MMDLREIIKWFIPCFHILRMVKLKYTKIMFVCLVLCLNVCCCDCEVIETKNVSASFNSLNQSRSFVNEVVDTGRTFGRPMKKMMAALIPLVFQIGAASTWAVVAALVGVKTLIVTLFILKILLVAGAAKLGALFGQKSHGHGWEPHWQPPHHPQKEIHLHIHNNGQHEEHTPFSSWSRDGTQTENKNVVVVDPYAAGPQTISTPYGNYVKVQPPAPLLTNKKKK